MIFQRIGSLLIIGTASCMGGGIESRNHSSLLDQSTDAPVGTDKGYDASESLIYVDSSMSMPHLLGTKDKKGMKGWRSKAPHIRHTLPPHVTKGPQKTKHPRGTIHPKAPKKTMAPSSGKGAGLLDGLPPQPTVSTPGVANGEGVETHGSQLGGGATVSGLTGADNSSSVSPNTAATTGIAGVAGVGAFLLIMGVVVAHRKKTPSAARHQTHAINKYSEDQDTVTGVTLDSLQHADKVGSPEWQGYAVYSTTQYHSSPVNSGNESDESDDIDRGLQTMSTVDL